METQFQNIAVGLYDSALPYSLEAEQSVLGAILAEPASITTIMDYVRPESFYRPQHVRIFSIMVQMFMAGQVIDFITVLDRVRADEVFETDEDAKIYLTQLVQIVPSISNIGSYARIVREKYYLRALIGAAKDIIENASDSQADAKTLLDMAEQRIFDIRQGRDTAGLVQIDAVVLELYDKLQRISGDERDLYVGIPSGFKELDRILTGLNRSDLILLAARPAMGKTSFVLNIASNVARKGNKKVAIFSLEMSKEQLVERMLSSEASIQGSRLRTGDISGDEWVDLALAAQELAKEPILIDDTAGITVAEIKARLRRIRDLGLVIIDYLQLMSVPGRNENRVQAVSEITRSLKIMAKELNVPVIVLSQLSRGPESRTDHRPLLSDLRESGSIEQDADSVLFLYRDAYYNRDSDQHNVAECIVAKNRHGETGTIRLGWDGEHTKFTGLEQYRNEP